MGDEERGVLEIGEVEEGTTHLARSMATEAGPAGVEARSHLLVSVDCAEGSLRGQRSMDPSRLEVAAACPASTTATDFKP